MLYCTGYMLGLYQVDPDGSINWSYRADFLMRTAPALGADGTAYLMSLDSSPGQPNSRFIAVKADGTLLWSYVTHEAMNAAAIGDDGTVYVGCDDGKLYAFGP